MMCKRFNCSGFALRLLNNCLSNCKNLPPEITHTSILSSSWLSASIIRGSAGDLLSARVPSRSKAINFFMRLFTEFFTYVADFLGVGFVSYQNAVFGGHHGDVIQPNNRYWQTLLITNKTICDLLQLNIVAFYMVPGT